MDAERVKYCQSCGQQLPMRAEYCDRCGEEQPTTELEGGDETTAQPAPTAQPTRSQSRDTGGTSGISRRRVVGGVIGVGVAAVVGGLLLANGGGSGMERVRKDEWSNRETEETGTGEIVTGDVTLEAGQYTMQGFSGIGAPRLGWVVEDVAGGTVDVWTVQEGEFEKFEDGDEMQYLVGLSESGISTSAEAEGRVDGSDDWYVIFDNTGRDSDANEQVEFTLTVGIGA